MTLRGALLLMVKQRRDDYSLLLPELDLLWLTTVAFSQSVDQAELNQFILKVLPVRQANLGVSHAQAYVYSLQLTLLDAPLG